MIKPYSIIQSNYIYYYKIKNKNIVYCKKKHILFNNESNDSNSFLCGFQFRIRF